MSSQNICDACGAYLRPGETCEQYFHQMLHWEFEYPEYSVVHHLMVLAYHIQHPHLMSSVGLTWQIRGLVNFILTDITPEEVRQQSQNLDSGRRNWKITSTPENRGTHKNPIQWTLTAGDIVAAGHQQYVDGVRTWANSVYENLRDTDNLPPG